jgi:porin
MQLIARVPTALYATLILSIFNGYASPATWNNTVLGFEPPPPGLIKTLLESESGLKEYGFNYQLNYLNQLAYNAGGGYDHHAHTAYIDQFSLTFTQDLEALTGIPDAAIEGNIVNRNHNDNLTTKRLQDPRVNFNDLSQESWGGQSITRLGWLTFSRSFFARQLQWRIGMMNKVQTFDQIIPCDFQLLTQCGGKTANSLTWNNWNVHTWGTSLAWKMTPDITLKTGIMEQNPDAASRSHAWSWSTRGSKGFLWPTELETKTHFNHLPGIYNIGALFTNARQYDLYRGNAQTAGAQDAKGYRSYNRTWFFWAGFNQQITQHADDANRGMSISFSHGQGDRRSNYLHSVSAASLRYRGLFDARPEDWIGIGVSYINISQHYTRAQQIKNAMLGIHDANNPYYSPVPGNALNAELYYRFRPLSWLELQPDLQFWHHPGGVKQTQDAWVTGLKTVVFF